MNFFYPDFASGMISENVLLAVAFESGGVVAVGALPGFDAHVGVLESDVLVQPLLRRHRLAAVGAFVPAAGGAEIATAAAADESRGGPLQGQLPVAETAEKAARGSRSAAQPDAAASPAAAAAATAASELMRRRKDVDAAADQR